jgi:anti-sigma-K factor RskA
MMDKEKILKEGLLELYFLDELDHSTRSEVEQAIASDDDLKNIAQELELNLEQLGLDNAISPPAAIKANLLKSISKTQKATGVKPLSSNKYRIWFSLAAAASVVLFLNTIFLMVQNGDIKQQLATLETEWEQLKKDQESLRTTYNAQGEMLAFLSHPETEQYLMYGNEQQPDARLVSYVNHKNKRVMVNTTQLNTLDSEHDYQMWADVEGEMINMGVIDLKEPMIAMNYIDKAESFNITIEPKGGSEHPTVSNLISNTYLR